MDAAVFCIGAAVGGAEPTLGATTGTAMLVAGNGAGAGIAALAAESAGTAIDRDAAASMSNGVVQVR